MPPQIPPALALVLAQLLGHHMPQPPPVTPPSPIGGGQQYPGGTQPIGGGQHYPGAAGPHLGAILAALSGGAANFGVHGPGQGQTTPPRLASFVATPPPANYVPGGPGGLAPLISPGLHLLSGNFGVHGPQGPQHLGF